MATPAVSLSQKPTLKSVGLTILAFIFASFLVQALSHFVINTSHYAGISFMRTEPIIPMGILVMVVQGTLLGFLFPLIRFNGSVMSNALKFSLLIGLFLASYIAIVEPSKYTVPSIGTWMIVEASASFFQFLIFGLLLGLIHKKTH